MPDPHAAARTIEQLVKSGAAQYPDKPAIIDPEIRITYRELDASTRELAAGFLEAGVGKGSRVGVVMPNSARWVQIAISLTRIGAVLVPLSTLLPPRELMAQCDVASVEYLVSVREFRGHRYVDDLRASLDTGDLTDQILFRPALPSLRRVWTTDSLPLATEQATMLPMVDALAGTVHPEDPLIITFTSGSSGIPKGVLHSHASALGAVASGLAARCITADTRLYVPMPFFWVGGFGSGILSTLLAGATLVTEQIPRPEATLRLLEREQVTLFRGWPDQAEALARHQERVGANLSALVVGSLDALLPADQRATPGARARLFGMTETFGPYCGFPADTDMPRSAWGSCGKPFVGMEVRICSGGTAVPTGSSGEIQVRGPHVLRGICRRSHDEIFTADGFYPTGDLGHLDDNGFLFYHGRSDDMFKVSGASVYPGEVEKALRSIAGIQAAYVTDVLVDGAQQVGAAVVCNTATTSVQALREAAAAVLSSFKVPTVWLLVDSDDAIPRGGTGKVPAPQLRELLSTTDPGARFAAELSDRLAGYGDAPFIEFDRQWYTGNDIARYRELINKALVDAGVGAHESVGIVVRNRVPHAAAIFDFIVARRPMAMIYSYQSENSIARDIEALRPAAVITDRQDWTAPVAAACRKVGAGAIVLSLNGPTVEVAATRDHKPGNTGETFDLPGLHILTSGTTGPPKRLPLPTKALQHTVLSMTIGQSATPDEPPELVYWPFGSIGICQLLAAPFLRKRMVLLEKFTVDQWVRAVKTYRITRTGVQPAVLRMVLEADVPPDDLASLQFLPGGSGPLDPELRIRFEAKYPVTLLWGYGATEFAGSVCTWTPDLHRDYGAAKVGSVGRPLPGIEVRIIDPDTEAEAPTASPGRLEARSQVLGNRWVATTDIASIDADGFVTIHGRGDGAINRGGFKILPETVRGVLLGHPSVLDACVVGVDDARLGQAPFAAVEVRAGWPTPSEDSLKDLVREALPSHHVPVAITIVEELPRNAALKVQVNEVAALYS